MTTQSSSPTWSQLLHVVESFGRVAFAGKDGQGHEKAAAATMAESVLREALRQHGQISLLPMSHGLSGSTVTAIVQDVSGCTLKVLLERSEIDPQWRGGLVQVFIQFSVNEKQQQFIGEAQLQLATGNGLRIAGVLRLTSSLHQGQRRRYMRVTPPSSMLQVVDARFTSAAGPRQQPEGGATTPSGTWHELATTQVDVRDISVGGLKAWVSLPEAQRDLLVAGCLCMFALRLVFRNGQSMQLLVVGALLRVTLRQERKNFGTFEAYVRFERQAESHGGARRWSPVNPQVGVHNLLPWITDVQFATKH